MGGAALLSPHLQTSQPLQLRNTDPTLSSWRGFDNDLTDCLEALQEKLRDLQINNWPLDYLASRAARVFRSTGGKISPKAKLNSRSLGFVFVIHQTDSRKRTVGVILPWGFLDIFLDVV
jgi:hypothetical protein